MVYVNVVAKDPRWPGRISNTQEGEKDAAHQVAGDPIEEPEHPIAPARGIVLGVVLALALWILAALLIRALF